MENIRVEVQRGGAVRTITIDRQEKRNALSRDMFNQLIELFEAEPPVTERVTVVRSEGHVFCSGIDLNERLVHGAPPLDRLCEAMRNYAAPIVLRLQGDAIAGGAFVALFSDFLVAATGARIWVSLVQIGLAPPYYLTRRLQELTTPAFAREMVLLGDPMPVERMAEASMIIKAVPLDQLDAEVDRIVDRLVKNAPLSLRAIKATLSTRNFAEEPHDKIEALIVKARDSQDGREGVQARLERRMPVYEGR